ncbi:MAG: hypothetical protein LBH07_08610, partial [Treponema sp.]|nr:hypothetical protein [Treponema sp.]
MKKNIRNMIISGFFLSFILISCKSTGTAPPAPSPAPARTTAQTEAQEIQKAATNARDKAREAGAEDLVPERFAQIDELIAESQRKYESGDYAGAIKDSKEASDRYAVLQTLAEA